MKIYIIRLFQSVDPPPDTSERANELSAYLYKIYIWTFAIRDWVYKRVAVHFVRCYLFSLGHIMVRRFDKLPLIFYALHLNLVFVVMVTLGCHNNKYWLQMSLATNSLHRVYHTGLNVYLFLNLFSIYIYHFIWPENWTVISNISTLLPDGCQQVWHVYDIGQSGFGPQIHH